MQSKNLKVCLKNCFANVSELKLNNRSIVEVILSFWYGG